ncbi:MAG TPA: galactokinase family protein, partial [Armatimonadota bacterium]|nr:galactokinase family protein [Armatimonadota bacterium]
MPWVEAPGIMADLPERSERLVAEAAKLANVSAIDVRVARSPYRVCPLGAHVDHQFGRVTGMAIDRSILLAFAPTDDGSIRLASRDFEGSVDFNVAEAAGTSREFWGRYAAGAVLALEDIGIPVTRGIAGVVEGELPIGGLSSSAAVSVAYLLALEAVNGADITPVQNIRLQQYIENVHIGLNNGILDQSVILLSERDRLLVLDCLDEEWELVSAPDTMPEFRIVVAYSGVSAALTSTGYNDRVAECKEAARELMRLGGVGGPAEPRLRDVPVEVYETRAASLEPKLARRARHFFTENARVIAGRDAWATGDLARFGELINESGQSSVADYECGGPELITLFETLRATPGVQGARFSGG